MSVTSTIEWTDASWNPVRGCTKISPGCGRCYAERFAERFRGVKGSPFEQGFDLKIVPEMLPLPIKWATPKAIFVNSMSDLFHEGVPVEYIKRAVDVMARANWHTYQVLTKRAGRMSELLRGELREAASLAHVWWGVSVEDRKYGIPRIDHLRAAPAAVRFLSVEPLLEDLGEINLDGIHWVIVGGESGVRPRKMQKEWVLSLRDQCAKAGVPFFFKQWGGTQKKKAGRLLDGRTYDEMPARSANLVAGREQRRTWVAEIEAANQRQLLQVGLIAS